MCYNILRSKLYYLSKLSYFQKYIWCFVILIDVWKSQITKQDDNIFNL